MELVSPSLSFLILIPILLRVLVVLFCYNRAKKLNRNSGLWALFGLFLPIFALILILFAKPLRVVEPEIDEIGKE